MLVLVRMPTGNKGSDWVDKTTKDVAVLLQLDDPYLYPKSWRSHRGKKITAQDVYWLADETYGPHRSTLKLVNAIFEGHIPGCTRTWSDSELGQEAEELGYWE